MVIYCPNHKSFPIKIFAIYGNLQLFVNKLVKGTFYVNNFDPFVIIM